MHVAEVGRRLDEIKEITKEIRECPILYKVATKEEQAKMWELIEAVFDRYEAAIENDVKYIPKIRRVLNRIVFVLRRWIEYDEMEAEKYFEEIAKFSGVSLTKKYDD